AGWPGRPLVSVIVGLAAGVVGILIRIFRTRATVGSVALFVDRRVPASRNVIVTAHELGADSARGYVPSLVLRRAAGVVRDVAAGALVPLRTALLALLATGAVWLFAVTRAGAPILARSSSPGASSSTPTIDGVDIVIAAPTYAGRPAVTLHNPERIEALA